MRVLIVKMSSLGDVIHTLPALTDAAAANPAIRFDWVVEEAFAEIPGWHPAVDKVIPIAMRRWRKSPLSRSTRSQWKAFRKALAKNHYDAVIDPQGLLKSALISRLVHAPRFGMDKSSVRERLASYLYHHKINIPRDMHAVQRIRKLFASSMSYALPAGAGDYGVRTNLKAGGDKLPAGLLFFHGTARAEKLWPEQNWVELAALVAQRDYTVWLPWGNQEEKARAGRIAKAAKNAQVLPRLDLLGLASMLMEVDGAIAVDTGLAHLSAALDVPTVSLYGPTDTRLIGAYGKNQSHIQSPIGQGDTTNSLQMMQSIEPAKVCDEFYKLLADAGK